MTLTNKFESRTIEHFEKSWDVRFVLKRIWDEKHAKTRSLKLRNLTNKSSLIIACG